MTKAHQPMIGRILRHYAAIIDQAPVNRQEKERLAHFGAFVLVSLVIMTSFCLYNVYIGDLLLASITFLCTTGQTFSWLLMCHLPMGRVVYRLNAFFFGAFLLYLLMLGGEDGSKSLWMFSYPLVGFFILGRNEGLVWTTSVFFAALALLFLPLPDLTPFPYSNAFLIRLATVYLFILIATYWFEYHREHFRRTVENESSRLKAVIDALPEAISLQDHEGRLVLCNRKFLAMTGLHEEQVVGKREEELLDWPADEGVNAILKLPLQGGDGIFCQLVVRNAPESAPATTDQQINDTHVATNLAQPADNITPHSFLGNNRMVDASGDKSAAFTPAEAAPESPSTASFMRTILLIDDDPMIRDIGALMLANLGYSVVTAADGSEGVDLFRARAGEIALVFCDQLMPGLNGWQTLTALRGIDPAIPVIMVSGVEQKTGMDLNCAVKPQAYLNKPYTMASLRQALDQALVESYRPV